MQANQLVGFGRFPVWPNPNSLLEKNRKKRRRARHAPRSAVVPSISHPLPLDYRPSTSLHHNTDAVNGWAIDDQKMAVSFYSVLGFNSTVILCSSLLLLNVQTLLHFH